MKFVLLSLLLFYNHACGHQLHCSTGVVVTNQAISLPSSRHAGAKVLLLRKYQASSLIQCLEQCCLGKYGACSVAEYKNNSADGNCFYYSCQPISKCKFMDSEGTDVFTFPSISKNVSSTYNTIRNNGEDHNRLQEHLTVENTTFYQQQQSTFKNHERAVAARKGVESTTVRYEGTLMPWKVSTTYLENWNSSKSSYTSTDHTRTVTARKGAEPIYSSTNGGSLASLSGLSTVNTKNGDTLKPSSDTITIQDILSKTDSSFKNDNTTIKPRKGVDPDGDLVSVKIKPRKGVEVTNPLGGTSAPQVTRSKVKPRKGVVPLSLSMTEVITSKTKTTAEFAPVSYNSVASDINSSNPDQILPSFVTHSSDLISVLEQVFRDESASPVADFKISSSTHSVATTSSNIFTMSSNPASAVKYNEYTPLPLYSVGTEQNSVSAPTETLTRPFQSVLPSKASTHLETAAESTPPLTAVSEHVKLQSESASRGSVEIPSPSRVPVLQTSMNSEYSFSRVAESTHHYHNTVLLFTMSAPKVKKNPLPPTAEDSESERKYKSSMHLVLSLVFGLLVLFVVFGAVAKRVYDVWMRRHYHRMDFLIDGMYDGFS